MSKIQKAIYAIAGIIAVVVIGSIFLHSAPQIAQQTIPYVTVSGSVTTTGMTTKPIFVEFTSDTGSTDSANVDGGSYSITLANQHSYSMTVHYSAGFGVTSGTCNGGTIGVYSASS